MSTRKPQAPADQPESQDFPFKYAGKNFVLRFGFRATSRLKDHWNLRTDPPGTDPRITGDNKLMERLNFLEIEDIPVLLWATLRSNHPELTVEDVEEMVDKYGVNDLQAVLGRVIAAAHPPADAKKKPTTAASR